MSNSDDMNDCANIFLEAAYDPSQLSDALKSATKLFDSNAAQLIAFDNKGTLLSSTNIGFEENAQNKWHEYIEISPRFIAGAQMKAGDIVFDYSNMTGIVRLTSPAQAFLYLQFTPYLATSQ